MAYDVKAGNAAINTLINRIVRSQETNNVRIHNCMVLIAEHASITYDCDGFRRLMNKLPAGIARNASLLIQTMTKYTPILTDKAGTGFSCRLAKPGSTAFKEYNIEGLKANPWYDLEGAKADPVLMDCDGIASKLLKLADSIDGKVKRSDHKEGEGPALTMMARNIRAFAKTAVPEVNPIREKEEQSTENVAEAEFHEVNEVTEPSTVKDIVNAGLIAVDKAA